MKKKLVDIEEKPGLFLYCFTSLKYYININLFLMGFSIGIHRFFHKNFMGNTSMGRYIFWVNPIRGSSFDPVSNEPPILSFRPSFVGNIIYTWLQRLVIWVFPDMIPFPSRNVSRQVRNFFINLEASF